MSAVILAALFAFAPAPASASDNPAPYASDLDLVIRGGGWGHGHGMSQYGAAGMAQQGFTWREIVNHYYTGVTVEDRGNKIIRVLLTTSRSVVVGGPEGYDVRFGNGAFIRTRNDSFPFTRAVADDDGVVVAKAPSADGPWTRVAEGNSIVRFTPQGGPAVPVWRAGRHEYFRGAIEARRMGARTMYAINELQMDEYLYGVVPREMPAGWHGQALRAQAVAARSYSMWKRKSAGVNASYHICVTTFCQVYRGYAVREPGEALEVLEHPRTVAAVDATSGQTMVVDGEGPIFAEYHSTSGGATGQGTRSYLAPVEDPFDGASPYHRWTHQVKVSDLTGRWPALGGLLDIRYTRNGIGPWGGRVETIRLVGTDSTVAMSGGSFRAALGIRSSLFTVRVYDSTVAGAPDEVVLAPGGTAEAIVRMKNTGSVTWPVGKVVRLGTADPEGRESAFRASSWITGTRVATITRDVTGGNNAVAKGEVAEIRFDVTAPTGAPSAVHHEAFRLHAKNLTWFGDVVTVPIRVGFDGASHLGGNLLDNPSFEARDGGDPAAWRPVADSPGALDALAVDGASGLRLPARAGEDVRFRQRVDEAGRAGDRFVVSGWTLTQGTKAARGSLDMTVTFRNKDGSTTSRRLVFPNGEHGWVHAERAVEAAKGYKRIEVTLALRDQRGGAWFDRVRLHRQAVLNGGFEDGAGRPSGWTINEGGSGSGRITGLARQGTAALRLNGSPSRSAVAIQRHVDLSGPAGDAIRLGGWSRTVKSTKDGGAVRLRARLQHADGTRSEHSVRFPRASHDWVYGEAVITAPKAYTSIDLSAHYTKQRGTAWFDDVVVGPATALALAANGGFEFGRPEPGAWSLHNVASSGGGTSLAEASRGAASLHLVGTSGKNRYARQRLPIGGDAGDSFTLTAWSHTVGSSASGGPVQVRVRIHHANGSVDLQRIDFDSAAHGWTSGELDVVAEAAYVAIDVEARFANQSGDAYFDRIRLRPTA